METHGEEPEIGGFVTGGTYSGIGSSGESVVDGKGIVMRLAVQHTIGNNEVLHSNSVHRIGFS